MGGARDRALLLVGFVGALRRSELAAISVEHLGGPPQRPSAGHPHSKTNQHGEGQLVVPPYATRPTYCFVLAIADWLAAANIATGPVFRPVHRNGKTVTPKVTEVTINRAVQQACARALRTKNPYSAHSPRAGFAT